VAVCRGLGVGAAESITLGKFPLSDEGMIAFIPSSVYIESVPHYIYHAGPFGVGYYRDWKQFVVESEMKFEVLLARPRTSSPFFFFFTFLLPYLP
jgi:hypothetical protein